MTRALVVTTAGTNCDLEMCHGFELAGASVEPVHLNMLMAEPELIDGFDLIGLPGGFSYGDAVAAGRIAAQLMRQTLYSAFVRAIERGVPIFAPCNGFPVAAQLGLLPGAGLVDGDGGLSWPAAPPAPTVTLAQNATGRFVDRWVKVEIPADTRCIWTQGIDLPAAAMMLPVAHGEGRFIAAESDLPQRLAENGQVAVRYASDDNPNGSMDGIAGICDASGLVFGLMPHPERYTRWMQHPFWTRLDERTMSGEPLGLRMFRNAVAHAEKKGDGSLFRKKAPVPFFL